MGEGARETRGVGRVGEWGALGFGFGRPGELREWGGPARLEGWPAGPFGPVGQGVFPLSFFVLPFVFSFYLFFSVLV